MAAGSLLALLDDIATILDDVALMTKVAAKKSAAMVVPGASFLPLRMPAAARRSSMRLLVQLPMKIFSIGTSCIRVPGSSPI